MLRRESFGSSEPANISLQHKEQKSMAGLMTVQFWNSLSFKVFALYHLKVNADKDYNLL